MLLIFITYKLLIFKNNMNLTFYFYIVYSQDPIPEFLPLMHARLYLVKAIIQVYENIFHILGIEGVREI